MSREKNDRSGQWKGTEEELAPPMPSRPEVTLGSVLILPGFLPAERLPEFPQESRAKSGP